MHAVSQIHLNVGTIFFFFWLSQPRSNIHGIYFEKCFVEVSSTLPKYERET